MSHKFNAGDKGRTRGGQEYEVLVDGLKLRRGESLVVLIDGGIYARYGDGRYSSDVETNLDLLPPPRKIRQWQYIGGCSGSVLMTDVDRHGAVEMEWELDAEGRPLRARRVGDG